MSEMKKTNRSGVKRRFLHRRHIDAYGYLREDGLWDIEGVIQDTKGYDLDLIDRGLVPEGGYLHHLRLTITVDDQLHIVDACAEMLDTPYLDCPGAAKHYEALVGLTIGKGWINEARQAIGRVSGCTHLTELLPVLASAAMQTIRGYHLNFTPGFIRGEQERNAMMNTCHGFRSGGRAHHKLWPDSVENE